MCVMWAVSLRHAASDTAFRPSLLMGARSGSALDILVVSPGTCSSVRRVSDNYYVQQYVGGRKCATEIHRARYQVYVLLLHVSGIRTAAV